MSDVLPIIFGGANIPSEENVRFSNLLSLTEEVTVDAQPSFFDGARPSEIDSEVRETLRSTIVPTKQVQALVAPNFFLAAKGTSGGPIVAMRQVIYDLALRARAMRSLQTYKAEPAYDGNAYTYGATYHAGAGLLQLYSSHVTAPTTQGGRPEYHVTWLKPFFITERLQTFVEGAAAFRNLRDLAREHRNSFIESANARAQPRQDDPTGSVRDEIASGSVEEYAESQDIQGGEEAQNDNQQCDSRVSLSCSAVEELPTGMTSLASSFSVTGSKRPKTTRSHSSNHAKKPANSGDRAAAHHGGNKDTPRKSQGRACEESGPQAQGI